MSWIKTKSLAEADGALAKLYQRAVDPATGELDHIMSIHALHPEGLEAHLALYSAVMRGTRTLPKAEREMIALWVSKENGCHY